MSMCMPTAAASCSRAATELQASSRRYPAAAERVCGIVHRAPALHALPHTIRQKQRIRYGCAATLRMRSMRYRRRYAYGGTCAHVVGTMRSSAKRLPKFEGLLAFVDGSNAERSARGLQYTSVNSLYMCPHTRYVSSYYWRSWMVVMRKAPPEACSMH